VATKDSPVASTFTVRSISLHFLSGTVLMIWFAEQHDGRHFVHTNWQNGEIVFHVSTMLAGTPQQRKVHIGNDAVVIVFLDSNDHFSPEFIHSKFNRTPNPPTALKKTFPNVLFCLCLFCLCLFVFVQRCLSWCRWRVQKMC